MYEKFLGEKLNPSDRWFVDFLFIADSYFALKTNYIFARTDYVFSKWSEAGYSIGQAYNALIYLFNVHDVTMEEFLRTEYIMMLTFMEDPAFLSAYRESSEFEKNELHEYIIDNYSKGRYTCLVTSKFSPNALNDCVTVLDEAKILFFAHYIKNSHPISLEDMLDIFEQAYTRFFRLNAKRVMNFIMMYEDVFRMTYLNLFSDMQEFYTGLNYDDKFLGTTGEKFNEEELKKAIVDPLDYTTTETVDLLIKVNTMFSIGAKTENGYRCALDDVNHCRYFTSRESGHPYLEIHQLIPRDYAGEFNVSIERASNYVALCPHCHRLIHEGTDVERFKALSALYWSRKNLLDEDGIVPTNELLFAIYGIEQGKLKPGENDFTKPLLAEAQPKLAAGQSATKAAKAEKATKTEKADKADKEKKPAAKKPAARKKAPAKKE
ncbi:MAG: HNH endonuclease [Clostridiales bacterium]|nr:HNH endonuclease [Clostridiales bacterium]